MKKTDKTTLVDKFNSPTLRKFISVARLKGYQLPGQAGDEYVIATSGGADSTVLLILITCLFPGVPFHYVFTDTRAEPQSVYEMLDRLEALLGITIERVTNEEGLYQFINDFGGYLPNAKARWCTRLCKTEPMEDYLEGLHEGKTNTFHQFVGLRADEPGRVGLSSDFDWLHNHMPFRDLGMVREDVFNILSETVGIPQYYSYRSRSGCSVCLFMRQSEMIGTLQAHRDDFIQAEQVEKLSDGDTKRYAIEGTDWSHLPFTFPIPPDIDLRTVDLPRKQQPRNKVKRDDKVQDLFGEEMVNVYVGIEYFVDLMMPEFTGFSTPGVWYQNLVGFSTTRGGLARKLNIHYQTKLNVAEVHDMSQAKMRESYRQAIFMLEVPRHLIDLGKMQDGSYTWKQGESMAQLRQVVNWVKRTLHVASLDQELEEYANAKPNSWAAEHREGLFKQRQAVEYEVGTVLSMERFIPTEKEQDMEEHEIPCFACSK